jgi:thioredoxin reductase
MTDGSWQQVSANESFNLPESAANCPTADNSAVVKEATDATKIRDCEVVIVGAGPYGLSAAAHLRMTGLDVRIFGRAMDFWASRMPPGMLLRSPRSASNISDPQGACKLEAFENCLGIRPENPIRLATFVQYGQWFQRQLVPELDERRVECVASYKNGFRVLLNDGEAFHCQNVVIAAGIQAFHRIPTPFMPLRRSQFSHSYEGCDVRAFCGKEVIVIGAGQSALETAALLQESGAQVEVIARIPLLRWVGMHPWLHNLGPVSSILYSKYDVGPAGISRLVAAPNLVRHLPTKLLDKIRIRAVRPAGSRWLTPRLRRVKVTTGRFVAKAKGVGPRVELRLDDGSSRLADHVVLGTGYSVDISRYAFLSNELRKQLHLMDGYPRLGSGFASSVPGVHFIGATAARSFGPLLYFVAGTEFASAELSRELLRNRLARR